MVNVKGKLLFVFLFIFILNSGCDILEKPDNHKDLYSFDMPENSGVLNTLKRAKQISQLQWVPLKNVPYNLGEYVPGKLVFGAPYSSVKEIGTYIGIDVTFHTFMTAVYNPRSVLYTERLNKPPYNGVNCATYYGTVCSAAVMYALGLSIPYSTSIFIKHHLFYKAEEQIPEAIKLCDLIWSKGHVVMVSGILRDNLGKIIAVFFLESGHTGTFIHKESFDKFLKRWHSEPHVIYKYKNLAQNTYIPTPYVRLDDKLTSVIKYNDEICVNKGDKSCYRVGEKVIINILDLSYTHIELYKDDALFSVTPITDIDAVYNNLDYGLYKTRLLRKVSNRRITYSDFTFFEVIDTNTSIELKDEILVSFSSNNAKPHYASLCDIHGHVAKYHEFISEEILEGYVKIPKLNISKPYYCKVFFVGDYGRISSKPIEVK